MYISLSLSAILLVLLSYYIAFVKTSVVTVNDTNYFSDLMTSTAATPSTSKTMYTTRALVVACLTGSLVPLIPIYILFFYKRKPRIPQNQNENNTTDDAYYYKTANTDDIPFVAILLSWEIGDAKSAATTAQRRKSFGTVYPDKYGAIDPSTGLPPMPERFLIAEDHDKDKALERWRDTLQWRQSKSVDNVLFVPHEKYRVIRKYYPQNFHCRDKKGNMVYIERPAGCRIKKLKKNGVPVEKLVWHYMYCMEYLWTVFSPSEQDRLTTILDLTGVSIFMVEREVVTFVKMTIAMTSTHYPARGHKLFIVNAPRWFGQVWSWVKPLLNPQTLDKLAVLTKGEKQTAALLNVIDAENLPVEYGGNNATEFGMSKYDRELDEYVERMLGKEGLKMGEDVCVD